jgi:Amt family ammonium transporter
MYREHLPSPRKIWSLALFAFLLFFMALPGWSEETPAPTAEQITELLQSPKVMIDTVWTLIAAMLVFIQNLGFGMVESGLCRAKNCTNILAKNFIVFGISSLAFLILV